MDISGLMDSTSDKRWGSVRSFPGRWGYEFDFQLFKGFYSSISRYESRNEKFYGKLSLKIVWGGRGGYVMQANSSEVMQNLHMQTFWHFVYIVSNATKTFFSDNDIKFHRDITIGVTLM